LNLEVSIPNQNTGNEDDNIIILFAKVDNKDNFSDDYI